MPSNFPPRAPIALIAGGVAGLLLVVPVFAIWLHFLPVFEHFYFSEYVTSDIAQSPIGAVTSFFRRAKYPTYVVMQGGAPVSAAGPGQMSVRFITAPPRFFHDWLRNSIYQGRELGEVLRTPLTIWIALALGIVGWGAFFDFRRRQKTREGLKLRGPDLMTRKEFNQATKGDGFALYVRD